MNPPEYPYRDPAQSRVRRSPAYSAFLPIFMILLIMILSSFKDVLTLIKRKNTMQAQYARAVEPLRFAGRQAEFINSLRDDLVRVAPSDPAAAAVVTEFFPPPITPPTPSQPNKASEPKNQQTPR